MKSKIVKAIFIGQNGSLGYKTNVQYTIDIKVKSDLIIIVDVNRPMHVTNKCEYSSMLTFLDNWDCIRVVGDESSRHLQ